MTKKLGLSRASRSRSRLLVTSLAIPLVLVVARPAAAQLWRSGGVNLAIAVGVYHTDIAYDPTTAQYLIVAAVGGEGSIVGTCTNTAGGPSPAFTVALPQNAQGPRAKFSPHLPNGVGGAGAFLVTWNAGEVFSQVVSCASPARLVGSPTALGIPGLAASMGPPIAYSATSGRFFVVSVGNYTLQGRFLDANGVPFGSVIPIAGYGSQYPGVTWNPATNEFGVSYTAWDTGSHAAFARVRATDGAVLSQTHFGYSGGTFNTDVAVNPATGAFVMGWALATGSNYALLDAAGNLAQTGLLSIAVGGSTSFSVDHNSSSGTFLAVGQDPFSYEISGTELNGSGFPIMQAIQLTTGGVSPGSYYPRTASRIGAPEWHVAFSRHWQFVASQIVATTSLGGGPAGPPPAPPPAPVPTPAPAPAPTPAPGGCAGPDPFAALGGGYCVNGGWQMTPPAGTPAPPAPAPAPPPSTGGCSGPDPFASLGGGLCQNGGWTMASTGCAGPDPFSSIGGGHCSNGGWVPGPGASAPAPPPPSSPAPAPAPQPAPSTCAGSDPFASLGGGHCEDGGWRMGPATYTPAAAPAPYTPPPTSSTGCTGPDPFASLGGGVCVGGGWQMPNMSCSTPNPFTSLPGGGVCINGGWIPAGMGGAPAPAAEVPAAALDASMSLFTVQSFSHEAPAAAAGRQNAELRT